MWKQNRSCDYHVWSWMDCDLKLHVKLNESCDYHMWNWMNHVIMIWKLNETWLNIAYETEWILWLKITWHWMNVIFTCETEWTVIITHEKWMNHAIKNLMWNWINHVIHMWNWMNCAKESHVKLNDSCSRITWNWINCAKESHVKLNDSC